jgi:hypothetical protein
MNATATKKSLKDLAAEALTNFHQGRSYTGKHHSLRKNAAGWKHTAMELLEVLDARHNADYYKPLNLWSCEGKQNDTWTQAGCRWAFTKAMRKVANAKSPLELAEYVMGAMQTVTLPSFLEYQAEIPEGREKNHAQVDPKNMGSYRACTKAGVAYAVAIIVPMLAALE